MSSNLIAIKIRRRSVAVAVFSGQSLEYMDTLHLCNEPALVTDAVARFLARTLEHFKPANAAIGTNNARQGERVKSLLELTGNMLDSKGIPTWKVEDRVLLESYAIPKLKNRNQLGRLFHLFGRISGTDSFQLLKRRLWASM